MLTSTECRDNERVTRVSSGKRRECLWQKKTDERVTDEKVVEIEMEIFLICATNLEKILICGIINIYFDLEMMLCI